MHLQAFLFATTASRRDGGPLLWSNNPSGYTWEAIELLKNNQHLQRQIDNGLWLVPIDVKTTKVRSGGYMTPVGWELIEHMSSRTPDFVEAVPLF